MVKKKIQKNYYHEKRKRERKLRLNFLIPYYVKTITHSKEQLVVNQGIFERKDAQSISQTLRILPQLTSRESLYLQTRSSLTSEFRGLCPSYVNSIFHTQEFLPWLSRTYLLLCVECTEVTQTLYLIAFLMDMKI